jgi:Fe-S cluster assembly ATP-binding protein
MKRTLQIIELHAGHEGKEILKGINLTVNQGEVHALMGPNGSGKSTLSNVIMGHPKYRVMSGDIRLDGESIIRLSPDKRAQKGLFLGMQYPVEVSGVKLGSFLKAAYNQIHGPDALDVAGFVELMEENTKLLNMDSAFAGRYVNEGFSGGEKKKAEILQMLVLKPAFAILDETDSGLDIDALKTVARAVDGSRGPDVGILLITHYQRLLRHIKPDFVHVLMGGKIVLTGGGDLAEKLEEVGYGWLKDEKYSGAT